MGLFYSMAIFKEHKPRKDDTFFKYLFKNLINKINNL